jgi:hypothetical protein
MPKYTPKPLLTNHFPLTLGNNNAGYNNSHFSTPTNLNSNANFNQFSFIQNINSGTNTQFQNSNTFQSSFNHVQSNLNNFISNIYHNKTILFYINKLLNNFCKGINKIREKLILCYRYKLKKWEAQLFLFSIVMPIALRNVFIP